MSMLRFQIIKRLITSVKIINVIHTMSVEWEGRKLKQKKQPGVVPSLYAVLWCSWVHCCSSDALSIDVWGVVRAQGGVVERAEGRGCQRGWEAWF